MTPLNASETTVHVHTISRARNKGLRSRIQSTAESSTLMTSTPEYRNNRLRMTASVGTAFLLL